MISKQDLRDVKLDKNELKTQVYINRGQPMIRLMAETNQEIALKKMSRQIHSFIGILCIFITHGVTIIHMINWF